MRVDFSPDYSNTIHRKRKLPSKIGYRVETSRSRDWITRNSNVEKKGRKGANHISLSLTSTHTYTHTHNVYSRCNEILSNYPSDHVSTPRVAVRPRMGEIPLEEGAANAETSDSTARAFSSCGGGVRDPAPRRVFASHFARVGHVAAAGSADPWTRKDAVGE